MSGVSVAEPATEKVGPVSATAESLCARVSGNDVREEEVHHPCSRIFSLKD